MICTRLKRGNQGKSDTVGGKSLGRHSPWCSCMVIGCLRGWGEFEDTEGSADYQNEDDGAY